ncbi:MAG: putative chaplin [Linnemannia elongata]|nr:MAG: putative chaplin [Linnemannia elongata]
MVFHIAYLFAFVAACGMMSLIYATPIPASYAPGDAWDSPGVAAGNNIKVPVHVPVNACGLTVNVVGVLNPAYGNTLLNSCAAD